MPFIRQLTNEEATGETRRMFDEAVERAGRVFNVVRIQGLDPGAMDASMGLYKEIMMGRGPLRRATREMLAVVVSKTLGCVY